MLKKVWFMLVLCSVLMVSGCSGGMPKDNMDSVAVSDLITAEVEQVETTVTEEQSGDSSNVEASNTEEPTVDTTTTEADTKPSTTEAPSESETVTTQPATPPMEQQPTTPEQTTLSTEAPVTEEDKEIMDWLDKVVYEGEYYDSLTEAVKWAILCFIRGEIRFREEMSTMELMQEFVRDFAKQSKADNERIMQDAVTRILATIISAMGQQAGVYVAVPAMMQMQGMNVMPAPPVTPVEPTEPVKEMVEELPENNLELSDKPLDD